MSARRLDDRLKFDDCMTNLISKTHFFNERTPQMDNSAEYWRRALAAREQARLASDDKSRATWLRIGESFETLFRLSQGVEEACAKDLVDLEPNDSGCRLH